MKIKAYGEIMENRISEIKRKTSETDIKVKLNIDGEGNYNISTGVAFLNHMLESFARHGRFDLEIEAVGDIEIDDHHTVEDIGIVIGKAFKEALGNKKGIKRMSHAIVPMDEALATVAIDLSGRSYFVSDVYFKYQKVGDLSTENIVHFFESFANNAELNLNMSVSGENDHHKAEALFKALAISLKSACKVEHDQIPSTKGTI